MKHHVVWHDMRHIGIPGMRIASPRWESDFYASMNALRALETSEAPNSVEDHSFLKVFH